MRLPARARAASLQSSDRRRLRQERQRLHRRRNGDEQPHRGVQPRRQLGARLGADRIGPGQFNKIRGIVIDAAGNLYVADAGNKRIQVFDSQGTFKSQITGIGSPQAICITGGSPQYLYSSNSNDPESMDNGEIYKISLDGKVVGEVRQGRKAPGEFGMVNSLDCRTENTLWVGEVWNWRAQKVTLKR